MSFTKISFCVVTAFDLKVSVQHKVTGWFQVISRGFVVDTVCRDNWCFSQMGQTVHWAHNVERC